MGIRINYMLNLMRELVDIMDRRCVLAEFKTFADLSQNAKKEEVSAYLLGQWMRIEWKKNKLMIMALKKRPELLKIVFGEIAQSFDKSIFANTASVNVRNSFLNSNHIRLVAPHHLNEDSIPERLCEDYDTLVLDIYAIPIPTNILMVIRTEMRNTGLIERILNIQQEMLNDLIAVINPKHIHFICRYKRIVPDCRILVDSLKLGEISNSYTFIDDDTLSGYRGNLNHAKWVEFIKNT